MVIGSHTDLDALRRVAAGATALTFDHEHVPTELLDKLVAEGVNVAPPPEALIHAQDKLVMRRRLEALGAPVPRYAAVDAVDDVDAFVGAVGGPVVIKTVRGGYDGRGVAWPTTSRRPATIAGEFLADGVPVLVEERVAMRRELSALVARSPFGQGAAWPVVRDGAARRHLRRGARAGAGSARRRSPPTRSSSALRLAAELGVVGVLAVELFETADGELLVNELAMRPHNSGHWTMDGARTSQFEQHLRAVLDYPLGDTAPIAPVTVMANVLGAPQTAGDEHGRAAAPPVRADAGREGAPVRQGGAAGPQDRARQHCRRRGGSLTTPGTCRRCGSARSGRRTGCPRASGPTDGIRMGSSR